MRRDPHGNPLHVRMHYKHSAYWYVYQGKWRMLGREYPAAMQAYAAMISPASGMLRLIEETYRSYELKVKNGKMSQRSLNQYRTVRAKIDTAFMEFSPSQVKPNHIAEFLVFHYEQSPGCVPPLTRPCAGGSASTTRPTPSNGSRSTSATGT